MTYPTLVECPFCKNAPRHLEAKSGFYTDFYLVESGEFIEIKPRNLLGFGTNPEKFAAARRIHGDKFKIFTEDDFHILERREIDELYENGHIEWVERFEKKYRESNPDKGVS